MIQVAAGLALALIAAIFAVQNATPVTIRFLFWKIAGVPLVIVILGSLLLGALVIGLLAGVRLYRLRRAAPPAAPAPPAPRDGEGEGL